MSDAKTISSKESRNSNNGFDKNGNTSQRKPHSAPPKFQRKGSAGEEELPKNLSNEKNVDNDKSHNNEDEDDPCAEKRRSAADRESQKTREVLKGTPGPDPRFQQQNQTLRCFVMYEDFYRCEKILGEGHEACTWFRDVYQTICPNAWISRWDELRENGRFPWRHRSMQLHFSKN